MPRRRGDTVGVKILRFRLIASVITKSESRIALISVISFETLRRRMPAGIAQVGR